MLLLPTFYRTKLHHKIGIKINLKSVYPNLLLVNTHNIAIDRILAMIASDPGAPPNNRVIVTFEQDVTLPEISLNQPFTAVRSSNGDAVQYFNQQNVDQLRSTIQQESNLFTQLNQKWIDEMNQSVKSLKNAVFTLVSIFSVFIVVIVGASIG